jgi:hypothetical protein
MADSPEPLLRTVEEIANMYGLPEERVGRAARKAELELSVEPAGKEPLYDEKQVAALRRHILESLDEQELENLPAPVLLALNSDGMDIGGARRLWHAAGLARASQEDIDGTVDREDTETEIWYTDMSAAVQYARRGGHPDVDDLQQRTPQPVERLIQWARRAHSREQ